MAKKSINAKEIISCFTSDLPNDLIGAAVYINEQLVVEHAGIFIRYNGASRIFHYDGTVLIENIQEGEWYFFKEIMFINPEEVYVFLAHAELVVEYASEHNRNVGYGFFYNGNGLFEAATGQYIDETGMPQRMSCVGFCLNYLKSYLNREYFYFQNWGVHDNRNDTFNEQYIPEFINRTRRYNPNLSEGDIIQGIRRIMPIEYITGGFSPDLPVVKIFTDEYHPDVQEILLAKIA